MSESRYIYYALALVSYKLHEYGDCIIFVQRLLSCDEETAEIAKAYYLLALSYRKLGMFDNALANYTCLLG